MKRCQRCKQNKPADEFYKNANQNDGLQQWCKVCLSAYNMERYRKRGPIPPRDDGFKRCSRCKETASRTEFAKNPANRDGRDWYCRSCKVLNSREARERDPERYRQYNRQ